MYVRDFFYIIKSIASRKKWITAVFFIIPRILCGDKQRVLYFFICVKQGGCKTQVDYFIPKSSFKYAATNKKVKYFLRLSPGDDCCVWKKNKSSAFRKNIYSLGKIDNTLQSVANCTGQTPSGDRLLQNKKFL